MVLKMNYKKDCKRMRLKLKWSKLLVLFSIVFTSCENGYEKSWFGNISFNEKEIQVQDKSSFEILNHDYAKDKISAYYRGVEIEGSDGASFELLQQSYSKDKNHVYICNNYLDGTKYYTQRATDIFMLEGEDPSQFTVIDEHFAKGNLYAYYGHTPLLNSHGPSFNSLGGSYGKDRNHVYHEFNMMLADASSFRYLKGYYAIDKNNAFYQSSAINGVDVTSFRILNSDVTKDKHHVYFQNSMVEGIDSKTYEFFPESMYAKDKYAIYWVTEKVKGADVETFVVAGGASYARDKNNYYRWETIIKSGDSGYENAVNIYK